MRHIRLPGWLWALVAFGIPAAAAWGAASEMRGLWVTASPGLRSATEVARLVSEARGAGFNALFVQVRKNGEVGFASELEPRAAELPAGFDPLAEVLKQAHDPTAGARLEVHAWMDTLLVGNSRNPQPVDARHVLRRHPEWVSVRAEGTNSLSIPVLDPGVPGVQEHLVALVRELVSRYAVDGLYLDQLHYPVDLASRGFSGWGLHSTAVARFQQLHQRRLWPAAGDPAWGQFRRDQVSAILRRISLETALLRPSTRLSVGCIAQAGDVYPIAWEQTVAYATAFQDWRQWLREGLVDTAVLRMYFDAQINPRDWREWSTFLQANPFNRPVMVLVGAEFNRAADTLALARTVGETAGQPGGLAGIGFHSYGAPAADHTAAEFFSALVRTSSLDTQTAPLFAQPAAVPGMGWKAKPNRGRLLGRAQLNSRPLDGASVELKGRATRTLITDANGWFGAVDLLAGSYLVRVRPPGTNRVDLVGLLTITNGLTARPELMDAAVDLDGDGYANGDELTVGTDPLGADSHLGIEVTPLADRLSLRVRPVAPNRRYVLESASLETGPWKPVTDSASLDGSEAVAPFADRTVFFRVRVTY